MYLARRNTFQGDHRLGRPREARDHGLGFPQFRSNGPCRLTAPDWEQLDRHAGVRELRRGPAVHFQHRGECLRGVDRRADRQPPHVGRSQHEVAGGHARSAEGAHLEPTVGAAKQSARLADHRPHHVGAGRHFELDTVHAAANPVAGTGGVGEWNAVAAACDRASVRDATDGEDDVRLPRLACAGHRQIRGEADQDALHVRVAAAKDVRRVFDLQSLLGERRPQGALNSRPAVGRRGRRA